MSRIRLFVSHSHRDKGLADALQALLAGVFGEANHDVTIAVTNCGRVCFKGRKVNLSQALVGQAVGVTQVGERIWLVTFMQSDLGFFDDETCRLEPIANPFGPKVSPMYPQ